jgi:hypothetical protein
VSDPAHLIDELSEIGANIRLAGGRIILRAGMHRVPASLVRRIRQAKCELIEFITTGALQGEHLTSLEKRVIRWLNEHPAPSRAGECAWCRRPELPDGTVLPFGTEPGTHTWLHAECWPAWHRARRSQAIAELAHGSKQVRKRQETR